MPEELHLVRDLALILISAGIITIISKALKQPLVLGYIIAGFLIGPNFPFFPGISSVEMVKEWSEIGIIFLMFGLGLEFSFKKLMAVGGSAASTAGIKFLGGFIVGFIAGNLLGWSTMESIFLGGLLSMSSTVVILKSYDEMNLKHKPFAASVFGSLIVEDLIAILLMVIFSTMAVSQSFAGKELLENIVKLAFFLILWFLTGIYFIPTLLKKFRKHINEEILLIVSLGLCFGMVALATGVGFSAALGAFVMGSILAETIESEKILHIVEPIKNLFGAVFFVSVGMMVSPAVIAQHWVLILFLSLLVIVSDIIFAGLGMILSGKGLDNAVHAGFSLAQLGEFGFIIASIGVSLGVMRDFLYPIIIAVSVITTFATPYMIKLGDPFNAFLRKRLPAEWIEKLAPAKIKHTPDVDSEWKILLKSLAIRVVLYGVVIIAVYIGSKLYLDPLIDRIFPTANLLILKSVKAALTLLVMSPFIYGIAINTGSERMSVRKILNRNSGNSFPIIGLIIARSFIAVAVVLTVLMSYFELGGWTILAIIIAVVALVIGARISIKHMMVLEKQFMENFNQKETLEMKTKPVTSKVRRALSDYNVSTEIIVVSPDSTFAGSRLKELPLRSETGANIIKLTRGSRSFTVPDGETELFPGDRLLAVGTSPQIEKLRNMMSSSVHSTLADEDANDFKIVSIVLDENSFLTDKVLRSTNLRQYKCMIICVLSGNTFITNPEPDYCFSSGDTVWIAGDTDTLGWS